MAHDGRAARGFALAATFFAGLALTGCTLQDPPQTRPRPAPGPAAQPSAPTGAGPSRESLAVARHFQDVERDLLARGLMRTDGGGPDTPWGPRELTENFVRIALYDEYSQDGGRLIARERPSRLRRWQAPVRIGLRFGASVSAAQRAHDRAAVAAYATRLARASNHPVRLTEQSPNFWLYIVSEDERPSLGPEWAGLFPGLPPEDLKTATDMPLATFCLVMAMSDGDSPVYTNALAVVRAELPDLMRLSCLHEELAQGLGLANDFTGARPSIFNDNEEFATLTRMDEALLSLLYDRRLTVGMREPQARALLPDLVAERLPGGS